MRIVTKVPLRVSFFGGGTDIPPYCNEFGGEIIYSTINRYAYCEIEAIQGCNVIVLGEENEVYCNGEQQYAGKYGIVKAVLSTLNIKKGCRIKIYSDVLQGTGLGGSSAQIAAIVLACYGWEQKKISKRELAKTVYDIERLVLRINGGYQDPITTVHGGIGYLRGHSINDFNICSLKLQKEKIDKLRKTLLLFYTGVQHDSSAIITEHINKLSTNREQNLRIMHGIKNLAIEAEDIINNEEFEKFGKMLDQGWTYKRQMAESVSSDYIDYIYDGVKRAGAYGGKILGAGGGGYLLLCIDEKKLGNVKDYLCRQKGKLEENWRFDFLGAQLWVQL